MSVTSRFLAPCTALVLAACALAQSGERLPADLPQALTPRLTSHLRFLSSDALAGRETGTPGGDVTAQYVASVLQGLGLQGAGDDGGFLQAYPLTSTRLVEDGARCVLEGPSGQVFALGDGFVPRGVEAPGVELAAEVVFVGYGVAEEKEGVAGRDPLADLDLTGRFALALMGPQRAEGQVPAVSWRAQERAVLARGATALLLALPPGSTSAAQAYAFARRNLGLPRIRLGAPADVVSDDEAGLPRVYLASEAATAILAAGGLDLAAEAKARETDPYAPGAPLPGVRIALAVPVESTLVPAHNVAALLPGSDPGLAHEVVVLSAHMDHVGVAADGDVYNGADDNASGTTALLLAAEILAGAERAPRRSILFLAVSAEEKGLLGSEWWVAHPTVPLEHVVADINVDMVGRNDPHSVGATPSREHPEYNSLVQRAVELAPSAGLTVRFQAGEGEFARPVDSYYARSDHQNFSKVGIPVVFFFSGEHADYHRVTDTFDKLDLGKVGRVAGLVASLLADTANADGRPTKLAQ